MSNRSSFAIVIARLTQRARLVATAMALLAVIAVVLQPAAALTQSATAPHGAPTTRGDHHPIVAAADHDRGEQEAAKPVDPTGHGLVHLGSCLSICCLAMLPTIALLAPEHHPASIRRKPPIAARLTGEAPALDPPPPRAA